MRLRDRLSLYVWSRGSALGRRLIALDVLGHTESLVQHMKLGSDIVAIGVARILRLFASYRSIPRIIREESSNVRCIVGTTILTALIELVVLLDSEHPPGTALLWLGDLREACLAAIARDAHRDDLCLADMRLAVDELWREILATGGQIASDVLPAGVGVRATRARPKARVAL